MIAIDVTPCCGQATGVGRYVQDLLTGLAHVPLTAVYQGHHGLPSAQILAHVTAHARYDFLGGRIGARLRLGKILSQQHCTLYHSTSTIAVPGPAWSGAVVTTIHDCHPLEKSQVVSPRSQRLFRSLLQAQFRRSQLIITPSNHTAAAVRLHGWQGPLHIIPHGILTPAPSTRPTQAPPTPYLLTVGAIAPNKGLSTLAQAMRSIPALPWFHIGPVRYDPGNRIQNDMRLSGCQLLGYVSEQERQAWLMHAWVLCQPSLAEGFGYPPLEAMACGIPVIARRAGALPEILGDAPLWIEADNELASVAALADALRTLQHQPDQHRYLAQQAREQATHFSHKRMIDAHLHAYREASQCVSPS